VPHYKNGEIHFDKGKNFWQELCVPSPFNCPSHFHFLKQAIKKEESVQREGMIQ